MDGYLGGSSIRWILEQNRALRNLDTNTKDWKVDKQGNPEQSAGANSHGEDMLEPLRIGTSLHGYLTAMLTAPCLI